MTFALPTANNLHNVDRSTNARFVSDINSPSNTGTKAAGSLPITNVASEFDNNTASSVKGVAYEFLASGGYDVSSDTKLLIWHLQFNAPNRIQIGSLANGGVRLTLHSGTGAPLALNARRFDIGGNDTPFAECIKGAVPFVIDLNCSNHDAVQGTYDNTDVTQYSLTTYRTNLAGTSTNWNYYTACYVLDTTKTSSSTPTFTGASDFQDAVDLIQGSDYTDKIGNWVRKIGSVVFIDLPFRIGDNSTSTQFDDEGATVVSPSNNDSADPRNRLTDQSMRVYCNLRNNVADTLDMSGTYIWGTRAAWDLGQSDAAVITFDSPTFTGMGEITIGSSVAGPATFDNVNWVTMDEDADLDGSTFRNTNNDSTCLLSIG